MSRDLSRKFGLRLGRSVGSVGKLHAGKRVGKLVVSKPFMSAVKEEFEEGVDARLTSVEKRELLQKMTKSQNGVMLLGCKLDDMGLLQCVYLHQLQC